MKTKDSVCSGEIDVKTIDYTQVIKDLQSFETWRANKAFGNSMLNE